MQFSDGSQPVMNIKKSISLRIMGIQFYPNNNIIVEHLIIICHLLIGLFVSW